MDSMGLPDKQDLVEAIEKLLASNYPMEHVRYCHDQHRFEMIDPHEFCMWFNNDENDNECLTLIYGYWLDASLSTEWSILYFDGNINDMLVYVPDRELRLLSMYKYSEIGWDGVVEKIKEIVTILDESQARNMVDELRKGFKLK